MSQGIQAQFYNGYQMNFGKNRVQYDIFDWRYHRDEKFDTYFYNNGDKLAQFAHSVVQKKLKEYELFFEYQPTQRFILQVYNNLSDFRQSNIGLITGSDESNIGGTTTISKNRAFIYFEGDYRRFEEKISAAVAELLIMDMLFGGSFTSKVANSTLLSLPPWFTTGLVRYMSEGWNSTLDNRTKDAILSGEYDHFNRLTGEKSIEAGHSIWHFIDKRYGRSVIPNMLYLARVSKSVESGFVFVLGSSFKNLSSEWLMYYHDIYQADDALRQIPEKENEIHKTKKNRVYQNLKASPDQKYIAYSTNEMGKYIVWLYHVETGKKKSLVRREHRMQQITDYSYPLIAWHPNSTQITYLYERQGAIWIDSYDLETKEKLSRRLLNFTKVLDYEYAKDGTQIVLSGMQNGQIDIYTFNMLSNTFKQITNDKADDRYPSFLKNNSSIVFSSNRTTDSVIEHKTQKNYNLFIFEKNKKQLKRLTQSQSDQTSAVHIDKYNFLYKSNQNGIENLNLVQFDSSIAFIDTTVHYQYQSKNYTLTNYKRNIENFSYHTTQNKLYGLFRFDGKNRMYAYSETISPKAEIRSLANTAWKTRLLENERLDSLRKPKADTITKRLPALVEKSDTSFIDFNHYIFDIKKLDITENKSDTTIQTATQVADESFKSFYYFTSFYKDKVVSQIDFGFLNESYQTYTGNAIYYNPGINVLLKMGIADMFENYRFTAGFRLAADFNSTEYLFSLENLKKRLDKQYIYHRQALLESDDSYMYKNYSHNLMYLLRYPFNQVSSVRGTIKYRFDQGVTKSLGETSLNQADKFENWAGVKLEYVYDNSLNLGTNLYQGWRNKVFVEAFKQIDGAHPDLYVFGLDFRHYQKIHRNMIWASRLAASTSLGENRLMYYLGSTDNWINFSRETPTFDESVKRNRDIDWAFQSLATNMRGFPQNIRNGNSFVVLNNEIRLPIVRYLTNTPVTSNFLYNLQLITFFDIGSAWTGSSPYDEANLYNTDDHITGPITIIVDNQKAPFVYGFGGGIRSTFLGYFIRADYAWGVDGDVILPKIFYLSLSLDF